MDQTMERICGMLAEELDAFAEKEKLDSMTKLDWLDKLLHAKKSIVTIMAMEEGGQSNNSYRSYDDRSYRGSYDGDMGGDMGGDSYARGRSQRTGRYVSREAGYSGHEDYAKTLETMLRQTGDPKKQEAIREALSALQSR